MRLIETHHNLLRDLKFKFDMLQSPKCETRLVGPLVLDFPSFAKWKKRKESTNYEREWAAFFFVQCILLESSSNLFGLAKKVLNIFRLARNDFGLLKFSRSWLFDDVSNFEHVCFDPFLTMSEKSSLKWPI